MSTNRGKRIPCHLQCTRCKGVLVSRSTKAWHTKEIHNRLHATGSANGSLDPLDFEIAPKAIPTFAEWNSQRSTQGNDEEETDEDSLDGNSSERSRAVKRVRRTTTLDLRPVCYFNSQFDVN